MSNQSNGELVNTKPSRNVFGAKRREADGDPIVQAMRRTEEELRKVQPSPPLDVTEDSAGAEGDQEGDPAPSAPAIAEERAQQLITNISSQMLGELRSLREQIDDLMRDMNERRELIREAIRAHAEFAETAIQHKIIFAESVTNLRANFEASRTPLPPTRHI
jgi:hypothetical protein